jgi:predicted acylesterase/phospholipase RssA
LENPRLKSKLFFRPSRSPPSCIPRDVARFDRLKAVFSLVKPILDDALAGKNPSIFTLYELRKTFKNAASDIDAVWKARGIHRSQELGEWLRGIFGEKKFADAGAVKELKIIAADVSRQKYKIYSKEKDGSTFLANAVHASVSIPLFFDPYVQGTDL